MAAISEEGKGNNPKPHRRVEIGQQLLLGSGITLYKTTQYEIVSMKFAKQIAGSNVAFRRIKEWTLWRVGRLRNGRSYYRR
jgi:hypothetical protein